jgi:hypothetical protein
LRLVATQKEKKEVHAFHAKREKLDELKSGGRAI